MKRNLLCLALCFATILGLRATATAQAVTPHVDVTAVDAATGLPIAGATIQVFQFARGWDAVDTDMFGNATVNLTDIQLEAIKDVFVAADKLGYYSRFSGNMSYEEEALPVIFDESGAAKAVLAMVKIPFDVDLWILGIPLKNPGPSRVSISRWGTSLPLKARVTNLTSRTTRITAKAVISGPSIGNTDRDHELNKTLGEKRFLLKPHQHRGVTFEVNMPAGLRDTYYTLRFEIERGWKNYVRREIIVCKGDYCE